MTEPNDRQPASGAGWPDISMGRRRFLATVFGGATSLLLQACGRGLPGPHVPGTPDPLSSVVLPPTSTGVPATVTRPLIALTGTAGLPDTDTQLHLPLVSRAQATPTADRIVVLSADNTATATLVPTDTPLPTPTDTPFPTVTAEATGTPGLAPAVAPSSTPRPTRTPYPPAPPSKLGLFVGYQHPKLVELIQTGNVPHIKTLEYDPNLMEFIKRESPKTILVARYTPLDQPDLVRGDPIAEARRFVEMLLPIATEPKRFANIDAWEAYNEPVVKTRDEMRKLGLFEAERTRLLAAEGIRSCIGNFSTGQPAMDFWPWFFQAIAAVKEHDGFLGLHEYSAPYMWFGTGRHQLRAGDDEQDEGWLTLRYRKVYRQHLQPNDLEVPLLITETGIDGGITERPGPTGFGWQDFQDYWAREGKIRTDAATFYMEQLAWYDAEMMKDPYVFGSAIYAIAAPTGWTSFEIIGKTADLLQAYLAAHPRQR